MDLVGFRKSYRRESESIKPMETKGISRNPNIPSEGFYLIEIKATYSTLRQNTRPSVSGKSIKINDLINGQFLPKSTEIKMLKMKDEPTMLMKTHGTKTKCPPKRGCFYALFPLFSSGSPPNATGNYPHPIRAFRSTKSLTRGIALPFASPPETASGFLHSRAHPVAALRGERSGLVNSSCYFRVIAFEDSPVYRVCLPWVVSGKSRANCQI